MANSDQRLCSKLSGSDAERHDTHARAFGVHGVAAGAVAWPDATFSPRCSNPSTTSCVLYVSDSHLPTTTCFHANDLSSLVRRPKRVSTLREPEAAGVRWVSSDSVPI